MSDTTKKTGLTALGPYYDYSNEMYYPSELGIKRDGDVFSGPGQIINNARGIQYYVDTMAYGTPSHPSAGGYGPMEAQEQTPLGLSYFFNTGQQCSNGADMYQYMTTIPTGVPGDIGKTLKKTLGANLQGLAPGAIQDTFEAINPLPALNAVMGTGYPKCKLMEAAVGNSEGRSQSRFPFEPVFNANPTGSDDPPKEIPSVWFDPVADKVYYKPVTGYWAPDFIKGGYKWSTKGDIYMPKGDQPHMRRWVFDKWISQDEYKWTQKQLKQMGRLYTSNDIPDQHTPPDPPIPKQPTANQLKLAVQTSGDEGFARNRRNLNSEQIGAGVLFAGLFLGLVAFTALRK